MSNILRITTLNNNNVEVYYNVFERFSNGETRGWVVTEKYRSGEAYRELGDPPTEEESINKMIICDPDLGYDVQDLEDTVFDFDSSYTEEEQNEIKYDWNYHMDADAWLEHNSRWTIDEKYIRISGPIKLEVVSEEQLENVVECG